MVGMVGDLFPFEVNPGDPRGSAMFLLERPKRPRPRLTVGVERSRICRKARDYIGRSRTQQEDMQMAAQEPPCEFPLTSRPGGIVLDTNVVLDWLLFKDPSVSPLAAALLCNGVRWLATAPMRSELCAVLQRGLASTHGADAGEIVRQWDALVLLREPPPVHTLRCTDVDDQKFIDLAIATSARWLVTRDRALLKLARRAAPLGLSIATPVQWRAPADTP